MKKDKNRPSFIFRGGMENNKYKEVGMKKKKKPNLKDPKTKPVRPKEKEAEARLEQRKKGLPADDETAVRGRVERLRVEEAD